VLIANSGKSTEEFQDKRKKDQDKLTLGCLLEIMDGIIEIPGRIIIITTNYRKCLDPALTRPGRIDIEIEFKRLRGSDIAKIYEKWYGTPLADSEILKIRDTVFTQAEIGQLLFEHEKNSVDFLHAVSRESPQNTTE
jgi:chaperone BCS1